jgi:hypothetical protein
MTMATRYGSERHREERRSAPPLPTLRAMERCLSIDAGVPATLAQERLPWS